MRPALSTDNNSGSSRFQADDEISDELAHDISYVELLGCQRSSYERIDIEKKPTPVQMAEISWTTADVMHRASDTAFAIEAYRRGMKLVAVKNILSGKYYDSGKRKHRRKSKTRRNAPASTSA
jgi:hypothetical protein